MDPMAVADTGTLEISNLAPSHGLAPDVEEWIVDGLTEALPALRMRSLFTLRRDMLRDADLITLAVETPRRSVVGALSSRWCTTPAGGGFLHIMTQFVGERRQGDGIAFAGTWGRHIEGIYESTSEFPELWVLKTFNPIVYCAMRGFTRVPDVAFYPDIYAERQDPRIVRTAERVAAIAAPGHTFVPSTGIIRGAGEPADLYPWLPESRDEKVNDYFAATTLPGDRMLCMLSIPTPEAAETILRMFGLTPTTPQVRLARSMLGDPAPAPAGRRDGE
ncbi:hypothetical protein NE236_10675 [Actinoallomurus purpureus]|uniref:hypothetical protein n=1 Tax=Actinoallomurus purpureus TaxID=478114 RepID=UPI002093EB2B|nr:hypothetical protein [Actinoallomurus purpureus]MCO6005446.1 hypothetical protein [Actinoallomurus purpureus]